MEPSTKKLHPSFTLNGISYTEKTLLLYSQELKEAKEDYKKQIGFFIAQWLAISKTIIVETSGSTGPPKPISLLKKNMIASAKATEHFFDLSTGTSALLCLPARYIAGKMMLVRAMVLGWNLYTVPPGKNVLKQHKMTYDFAAMVPYQVHHSLEHMVKVKKLIIGGGAISKELSVALQNVATQIFETYGMTETITHIAVKHTNGMHASETFKALPNVTFTKDDRGCLVIHAPKITNTSIVTNDMVALENATAFTWLGRYDNVINSGGVKIHPEVVEAKLTHYINVPFVILSEPNETLGEQVILIVETNQTINTSEYKEIFKVLQPYERPKNIYTLLQFPYTETGKIKRNEVLNYI